MLLFFLSGSKKLLYSEVERIFGFEHTAVISLWIKKVVLERNWAFFCLEPAAAFFSLDQRSRFKAKLNEFRLRTCSCYFSQARRGCFGAKLSVFLPRTCSCFFSLRSKSILERSWAFFQPNLLGAKLSVFQPRTCSSFFLWGRRGRFWAFFQPRT